MLEDLIKQLLEAVREERREHEARMEVLGQVEAMAERLLDGSPPEDSPPQEPPEAEPEHEDPSPPEVEPPAPRKRKPTGDSSEVKQRLEDIVRFVNANPGCAMGEIVRSVTGTHGTIATAVRKLKGRGLIKSTGNRGSTRYWPRDASTDEQPAKPPTGAPVPPPAGSNGSGGGTTARKVKTDLEARVLAEVEKKPLPIGALVVRLKVPEKNLSPVLSGLVVRGVLKRQSGPGQPMFEPC